MTYIQEITFQEAFNQYDKSYMETCPESQGRRGLGGGDHGSPELHVEE